ncbi:MAG: carbohydrate ABC transporter permease [Anaerolineae bacterium]
MSVVTQSPSRPPSIRSTRKLQHLMVHLLLVAGAFVILIPFAWMVSTSLKPANQIKQFPPVWIPSPIMWGNWLSALTIFPIPFSRFVLNSLYYATFSSFGTLASSALVAFAFARLRFRGSNVLFLIVLSTMMLPGQVTMIPLFLLFSKMKWVNTYNPLIVPSFFASAYFVFLIRQFFATVPLELDDAARIDGCGIMQLFFRIMLPLAKPALGITAIFSFSGAWNDFMGPLIYLSEMKQFPLAMALMFLRGTYRVLWSELMVVSFIAMVPPMLLFFIAQKFYIQGIVVSGVKG